MRFDFVVDGFDLSDYVQTVNLSGGDPGMWNDSKTEGTRNPLEITVRFKGVDGVLEGFLFNLVGKVVPFRLNGRSGDVIFQGGSFPVYHSVPYLFVTSGKVYEA